MRSKITVAGGASITVKGSVEEVLGVLRSEGPICQFKDQRDRLVLVGAEQVAFVQPVLGSGKTAAF